MNVTESDKRFLASCDAWSVCGLASSWLRSKADYARSPEELLKMLQLTHLHSKRNALELYAKKER